MRLEIAIAVVVWLAFCGLVAFIAESRGRSPLKWFLASVVLSPLFGLIGALGLPALGSDGPAVDPRTTPYHGPAPVKSCPKCHGVVHAASTVCILCGKPFPATG